MQRLYDQGKGPKDENAGTGGLFKTNKLEHLYREHSQRIHPLVDVSFMERWLTLMAIAMAEENWEQLVDMARTAYREAQANRKTAPRRDEVLDLPLAMTSMSMKTLGYLEEDGILTVQQLLSRQRQQLMDIPNFGPMCLKECLDVLHSLGFTQE